MAAATTQTGSRQAVSKTYIPVALRQLVITDFDQRCAYCHSPEDLLDNLYEIDHILPEAAGGTKTRENLCYACPVCNAYKRDQWEGTDTVTQRRVTLFHPRRQRWKRHFAWSQDGTKMEGRTACGRATILAYKLNHSRIVHMRILWLRYGAKPPYWILPAESAG